MPDPQDALTRFRSAAASAVDRGRRIAGDAAASGAAFQRESEEQVRRLQRGDGPDPDARERDLRPTPADLRTASAEYRTERGLPVPELPETTGTAEAQQARPRRRVPPPDEDFSDFRIMGPV
jgi:hypothetical protein